MLSKSILNSFLIITVFFAVPFAEARRSQGFASGTFGYSNVKVEQEISSSFSNSKNTEKADFSAFNAGFRFGALEKDFRMYGSYEAHMYEEVLLHMGLVNADALFKMGRRFYGYIGGHVGWGYGKLKEAGDAKLAANEKGVTFGGDLDGETAHGWVVGGQAGAFYRVAKSFDLEAGLRLSYMGVDNEFKKGNLTVNTDFLWQYNFFGALTYRF